MFWISKVLYVPPHPPHNRRCQDDPDDEIKSVKKILECRIFVPLLAQPLSDIG
jgi:hypothetical protein